MYNNKSNIYLHPARGSYVTQTCFSIGAVEYTDCFSAEGVHPRPNECPVYDAKQSDGEVPASLHCHCIQVHSGPAW